MRIRTVVRATLRGTQFILHLALGSLLIGIYRLGFGKNWHLTEHGQNMIRWWMQMATHLIGIRIFQYGRPLTGNALYISNHISFLDIAVISSVVPVRFLAKHSVRYWPIIGYLTALSGSLFIKRHRRNQLVSTLASITSALTTPRPVLIFPEGTTSLGANVLKFHSGLFQAAIDTKLPIQPLVLHYRRDHVPDRLAAYIDKDNFLLSLLRLMRTPHTEVHLSFTPPVDSDGHTRRSLAAFCHARINQNLQYQLQSADTASPFDDAVEFAILGECKS